MGKKEYGWCPHLNIFGFFRAGGSTALRIDMNDGLFIWKPDSDTIWISCAECYWKKYPIGLRPDVLPDGDRPLRQS